MFTIESNVSDIYLMAAFGLLGYVLLRLATALKCLSLVKKRSMALRWR